MYVLMIPDLSRIPDVLRWGPDKDLLLFLPATAVTEGACAVWWLAQAPQGAI